MFPILFNFGIIKIYTIGIFFVLSFLAGSFVLWKNIKLTSFKEEEIFDGLFFSLIGAFIGSRFLYVVLNFEDFGFDILRFILVNGYPGLSIFGAFCGALITIIIYGRVKKISVLELSDYFISPLFLSLAIGKVGSFLGGVDIGTQTKFFLKVRYLGVDGLRHITAVYEALFFLIGFIISYRFMYVVRRDRVNQGTSLFFFMTWFGLAGLLFDVLKQNRMIISGISFNMAVSGILFIVGAISLVLIHRNELGKLLKRKNSS